MKVEWVKEMIQRRKRKLEMGAAVALLASL